jgi:transcriptional regulator with XRE-family HTH domain
MAINGFAGALRLARRAKQMSQEDFDEASSRIYISELERGIKNPTLNKIEEIAGVLGIHPLTLCLLAYADEATDMAALEKLQERIASEARKLLDESR